MSNARCCFLTLNGARCAMPAVNGKELCFTHENRRRRAHTKPCSPPSVHWTSEPLCAFRYPEDYRDIIDNHHSALDAFVRHMIDFRQLSAIDRHLVSIRKTLLQAERHEEQRRKMQEEEIVREVRYTDDGTALALPDTPPEPLLEASPTAEPIAEPVAEPVPAAEPDPIADSIAEPTADPAADVPPEPPTEPAPAAGQIIPTITAVADPESYPSPRQKRWVPPVPRCWGPGKPQTSISAYRPERTRRISGYLSPLPHRKHLSFQTPATKHPLTPAFPTLAKNENSNPPIFKHLYFQKTQPSTPNPHPTPDNTPADALACRVPRISLLRPGMGGPGAGKSPVSCQSCARGPSAR